MKTTSYRALRLAMIGLAIGYSIFFLFKLFSYQKDFSFDDIVFIIRGIILILIGLIIAIKLPRSNEHIFFALFLINFALTSWMFLFEASWITEAITWAFTGGSFVYAMLKYPGTSAQVLYKSYLANKRLLYKNSVLFFTDDKKFWLIFFPLLIILRIIGHFTTANFLAALDIVVNIAGLLYFRISYSLAGKSDKSRLAWILWGAVLTLAITIIELLVKIFYPEITPLFFQITFGCATATICISIIMGVFFSGFLDTALVLRSTIVYSTMFLVVIFFFSVVENILEHKLSHMLGIENDLINAFLAAFLALAIQPLHKKLEHILPKF
jgi:hypothetical protein